VQNRDILYTLVYLSFPSNRSSNPTSQPWNFRPLGGKNEALCRRHASISRIVSAGSETSSTSVLCINLLASVAETDFQKTFMARVPEDPPSGGLWAVVEYVMAGLRTQRLRQADGETEEDCKEVSLERAFGVPIDEGFQFMGRTTNREQHWASMMDCSCAEIIDARDGS
jgi:hypothetical protein